MKKLIKILIRVLVVLMLALGLLIMVFLRATEEEPRALSMEQIEQQEGVVVALEHPVRMDFVDYLLCDGAVNTPVRAVLRAKISETVEAVHVDVGQSVGEGQLLVELRKTDLEADIAARQAAYDEAKSNYERYQRLLDKGVVSKDHVEMRRTILEAAVAALQRAQSQLKFADLYAPIGDAEGEQTGRVQVEARRVEPGEYVAVGRELLTLVDLSQVEIKARVPETGVALCQAGQQVEFRLEGEGTWRTGSVSRISPSTESPNRFYDVFMKTENQRGGSGWVMRAGMYAEVRIPRAVARDVLGVQASVVKRSGATEYLFVARPAKEMVEIRRRVEPEPGQQGLKAQVRKRMARLRSRLRRSSASESEPDDQVVIENKELEVWRARRVEVQTGLRAEGYAQIVGGTLSEGDWLVSNPRDDLRDGVRVQPAEAK